MASVFPTVANAILEVMQIVADFLAAPATFCTTQALALNQTLEALRGSIQNMPVRAATKAVLNHRLTATENIISGYAAGTSGLAATVVLTVVLASLELLMDNILALNLPTRCGTLTVNFPCQFSTSSTCICNGYSGNA